ncbi:MAG: glycoside hydrolase 5 family protein [Armatimonadota bacterium]
MKLSTVYTLICAIWVMSIGVQAMTLTSEQPGNIFVSQQRIVFEISGAVGDTQYELKDYYGKLIAQGKPVMQSGQSQISVKGCPPGWYELSCSDKAGTQRISLGVVIDRKGAPLPYGGRICADAASAWLLANTEQRRPFAQMVAKAGIPWVRERLSWEGIEKQPGVYDWSHFQSTADTLKDAGIHVFQVWHMTPEWSRASTPKNTLYPADLRNVFKFTKEATSRFGKQWQAWEAWNEPDIAFWPDLSDRLSGYLKAAYLGLKAGDADATVLQCSLCVGPSQFSKGLYQNGVGEYYDVFNWHLYNTPESLPESLAAYRNQLAEFKLNGRPSWISEAGIRLTGSEGDGKRLLNDDKQRLQCQFIPQSAVMSLVAGNDKHFFFVLPDYLENGVQFGVLKPDLSPYPGFVALSTAANMLASVEYKGEYRLKVAKSSAHLFSTPSGNMLVAWSEKPTTVTIPTEKAGITVTDIFGSEHRLAAGNGSVSVKIGPEAVYILGIGKKIVPSLVGKVIPRGKLPKLNPSKIVVVGHSNMGNNKGNDCYVIQNAYAKSFVYTVEAYNFNDKSASSGSITVSVPSGWRVDQPTRKLKLAAMGRQELQFTIQPSEPQLGLFDVTVKPQFGKPQAEAAVSHYMYDVAQLQPVKRRPMGLIDAKVWQKAIGEGGVVDVSLTPDGWLQIDSRFTGNSDRWSYPFVKFEPAQDYSEFDGISFDLDSSFEDEKSQIQIMLVKKNGAHYIHSIPKGKGKRKVVVLFKNMNLLAFMPNDPEHKLTLNSIFEIKLGCNTTADRLTFSVSNMQLVKYPKR